MISLVFFILLWLLIQSIPGPSIRSAHSGPRAHLYTISFGAMFDPVDPRQNFPALEKGILQYWKEEDVFKRSIKQHCIPGDVLDHQGAKGKSCFDTPHCVTLPARRSPPEADEDGSSPSRSEGVSKGGCGATQHDTFSFYDGPPFATGLPHYGHLLAGTIKDVIPRYQTMRGKRVDRRFGWDCHGLPVENLVEKEEGLKSKKDIEEKGIRWFNDRCRKSVLRYTEEWRKTVERTGRWVDMDWDYRTMDPDFMESIWWAFRELHRKGLIYEGKKSMHVCPRCATPLSNFEVTLGYKDVSDWSVVVMFPLEEKSQIPSTKHQKNPKSQAPNAKTYFLAWTTTPWTLPGNLFLAVNPNIDYVKFQYQKYGNEPITCVTALPFFRNLQSKMPASRIPDGAPFHVKEVDFKVSDTLDRFEGKDLLGLRYEPLFPYFAAEYKKQNAFRIVAGDFVTTEEGTGIVHIATGFGDDDYLVGRREGVEVLSHVGMDGRFIPAVTDFAGEEVKPADDPTKTDKKIAASLKDRGRLFDQYSHTHSYPHCWRCDHPLINYATSSWFVAVEKIKQDLLEQNAKTTWVPDHIRDGRFGQWLTNARDWAISRNRFWGTPLPIWRCEETGEIEVLGSRDELMAKCPSRFTKLTVLRHAESEGNLTPIYQGENPGTHLTARGREQAETAARSLRAKPPEAAESRSLFRGFFDWFSIRPVPEREARSVQGSLEQNITVIYSSPLARAQQTAEIIALRLAPCGGARSGQAPQIIVDERLREVHFGDYEGKTVAFSDLTFVKERRAHKIEKNKPESIYHFDGMETWESVQERIKKFMEEILPRHRGEHIAIVTHADPVINIRHYFTNESPWKLSHQPYPEKAKPYTYFFDHAENAQMDLHRETVDELTWISPKGGTMRRIPDILDCWFESGSMPYAQSHFPFEKGVMLSSAARPSIRSSLRLGATRGDTAARIEAPPGFPADFIAEGLDQTRGWFYTLMVLSTALFKRPAFKNCIVNGIVLAEDGKKMSKRLKNYPEPEIVMEKFGADAMRFTLMSSPAVRGENLRFSERAVEETVRRVILPLWNAYSFFVLHANEAQWSFDTHRSVTLPARRSPPEADEDGSSPSRGEGVSKGGSGATQDDTSHPLDSWIKAELQDLTNRMTKQLDAYDLSATCSELHETLDALTNWYIRRSRRRFAGKEMFSSSEPRRGESRSPSLGMPLDSAPAGASLEENRSSALRTLYDVLITFSKLLAPFCPFITEVIYLNLVPDDHGSIHLTEWPATRELTKPERENIEKTRLLRMIVSLGMGLRAEANVKVRQPLSKVEVALPSNFQTFKLSPEDQEILAQELNVKEIRLISDASHLADRIVQVDARKVGPRLGGKVQEIIKAAKAGEFTENADGTVTVLGEKLSKEEAPIIYRGKEGQAVASQKGIVVALDTKVSAELKLEGLARDFIRSIQALRKEKGLKVSDRIHLTVGEGVEEVLTGFKELIERETNGSFAGEGTMSVKIFLRGGEVVTEYV